MRIYWCDKCGESFKVQRANSIYLYCNTGRDIGKRFKAELCEECFNGILNDMLSIEENKSTIRTNHEED